MSCFCRSIWSKSIKIFFICLIFIFIWVRSSFHFCEHPLPISLFLERQEITCRAGQGWVVMDTTWSTYQGWNIWGNRQLFKRGASWRLPNTWNVAWHGVNPKVSIWNVGCTTKSAGGFVKTWMPEFVPQGFWCHWSRLWPGGTSPVALRERIRLPMQEMPIWSLVGKIPWRNKWQPTPVFLPGKSHGLRSLVGYSTWGHRVGHDWARMFASQLHVLWPGRGISKSSSEDFGGQWNW